MHRHFLALLVAVSLAACASPQTPSRALTKGAAVQRITRGNADALPAQLQQAERQADDNGRRVLETGRIMTLEQALVLPGSCWDYINAVYNRAGFPAAARKTVFAGKKSAGPYAPASALQAGDWIYHVNHSYGDIEHSGIFVAWSEPSSRQALMLSYGGENRRQPARYAIYDLSHVYTIIRPR